MNKGLRDVTGDCRIRIDKDGRWYYEGAEIVNPMVIKTFCKALAKDGQGRYCIVIDPEVCYVEVEDTPFVVTCIRGEKETGLYLHLSNFDTVPLDPQRLFIGEGNVLYYTMPGGMKVRFTRQAYYSLANMMEEKDGSIVIRIRDRTHALCPVA